MKEDQRKTTLWKAFWHGHLDDEQLKGLKNLSKDESTLRHFKVTLYFKETISNL